MVISCIHDMAIFAFHVGFSSNYDAVQPWTLDASYQAKIRELIHYMAYCKNAINMHHELSPKGIQRD